MRVTERLLNDLKFNLPEDKREEIKIDEKFVNDYLTKMGKDSWNQFDAK